MTLVSLLGSRAAAQPVPVPLLEKGFRPFFSLGAAFAVLAVPLWLLALRGGWQPGGHFGAMQWHAHEMLFGYCTAVVAGFLLTAVSNWSGRETATGWFLAGLGLLWTLGRATMLCAGQLPAYGVAVVDLAFLPALAVTCAVPLFAARSRRNYGFLALLVGLSLANAVSHFAAIRGDFVTVRTAHRVALDVVVLMIVLVTGRIVPMFTRNATRIAEIRGVRGLELGSLAAVLLVSVADAASLPPRFGAVLAGVAGGLLLLRMRHWGSRRTTGEPLLWILHAGALALPLGFFLRAASALTPAVPEGSSLHALTTGAVGLLTLGMMARVSLGHTGRLLAAPRGMTAAFLCLMAAALIRVAAPLLSSSQYLLWLGVAAAAWSLAFAMFLARYWSYLVSPRVDAR